MSTSHTGTSDEKLFTGLAADLIAQAWVGMGKIKNPITDKLDPNLPAAALLIDMLDMLKRKTEGNRSPEEDKLLSENLQQLKLNYIHELDHQQDSAADPSAADGAAESDASDGDPGESVTEDDPASPAAGDAPSVDDTAAPESD